MENNIRKNISGKLENIQKRNNEFSVGVVSKVKEFIIEVKGMHDVAFFERVDIVGKGIGYVANIKRNCVMVALTRVDEKIMVGDKVKGTNKEYSASFSLSSIGNITNIFGEDKLTNQIFEHAYEIPVERPTVPIMKRGPVNRPLLTGIAAIDLMYPVGKGQRQLIIGDKKTGKTQIALDAIVNQKNSDMICLYISIGKTKKEVKEIYTELDKRNAMKNTIILAATNDDETPVLSLTPYAGLSMAEEMMNKGEDVLVIIDDLKRHADAYREISLLTDKTPGREAYPPDIFYTHSRLLEKGCQHVNGGSITILPIVETKAGDITDYISTNIISITDGQLVLSRKNFEKGQKPALNFGLSVSRLGGAVQSKEIKKIGATVRRELLSYLETREIYELTNVDEMSPQMQNKLKLGKQTLEKFNQYKFESVTVEDMIDLFDGFVIEKRD